jgi:hypothetical protein
VGAVVFWLIVLLAVYESVRLIRAFRRGEKPFSIIKEGIAAAAIITFVFLLLYVRHNFFPMPITN